MDKEVNLFASPADFLTRVGDIAAGALTAAATYGQLPPFPVAVDIRDDVQG